MAVQGDTADGSVGTEAKTIINIHYDSFIAHSVYLKQFITQYCGEKLMNIRFGVALPVFPTENCQQPFKNVAKFHAKNDNVN